MAALERIGTAPQDSPDQTLQKRVLVTSAVLIAALALVWGLVYIGFGEPVAGAIPLGYGLLSFASLAIFAVNARQAPWRDRHQGQRTALHLVRRGPETDGAPVAGRWLLSTAARHPTTRAGIPAWLRQFWRKVLDGTLR